MKKTLNIVCVDDEKIILDSLNAQLTRNLGNHYHYEFAESAEEALSIIDEIDHEDGEVLYVVISDWLMPGMKGDELLQTVRNKVKNVVTILLTGHVDNRVVKAIEGRNDGAIRCIHKPWNEQDLINLIIAK